MNFDTATLSVRVFLPLFLLGALQACGDGGTTGVDADTGDGITFDDVGVGDVAVDDVGDTQDTVSEVGTDSGSDTDRGCTPGTALCECSAGACPGGAGLACVDELCIYPDCEVGELGCACASNGACDVDSFGRQLRCDDGLCIEAECPSGEIGCGCAAGGECFDALICTDGICNEFECDGTGAEDCACNADRSCDLGLACVLGSCIDPGDCERGTAGCPCNRDNSCDAGASCDLDTDYCEAIACTAGEVGCECDAGDCAGDGIVCTDGMCEVSNCDAGLEGCECGAGDTCSVNALGEALECVSGICAAPSCEPGDVGCVCERGVSCDGDAVCTGGYCMESGCARGSENCGCINDVFCSGTLGCFDNTICRDLTGYSGGRCYADDTCERGNICSGGLCAACTLGTNGCQCDSDGGCVGTMVCTGAGFCEPAVELVSEVPEDPVCYSYCDDDVVLASSTISCSDEGLFRGCVDELDCVEGSCVLPGGTPPMCATDSDCPMYQTCIEGQCYSDCADDGDCTVSGETCYMHVCRERCTLGDDDCPHGTWCGSVANVESAPVCLPNAAYSDLGDNTSVDDDIDISDTSIQFTDSDDMAEFSIAHSSLSTETFTIRKLEHRAYFDDGTAEDLIDPDGDADECDPLIDCPLYWMSMYERGGVESYGSSITVDVPPGETVDVFLANATGSAAIQWTGTVEVIHEELGVRNITLSYAQRPDGTWSGTMYYFGQFDTRNLDAWRADRTNVTLQNQVRNAFVQRWAAFRRGTAGVTWREMQAVMTATESGLWEYASELDECPVEACYLYDAADSGVGEYSSDLDLAPVPTGLTELPISLNLRQPNPVTDPELLEGRIESANTLHYAGDPAVTIRMQDLDGEDYHVELDGQRITYLDGFDAVIDVGGRYETNSLDTNCTERVDGSYELFQIPWLLTDFTDGVEYDSSGLGYRYECRDASRPFDTATDAAYASLNVSLAQANPIPDARTRRRQLSLVDGVLVNGSTLVLLFEEQMDATFGEGGGVSAYGYIILEKQTVKVDDTDVSPNDGVPDAYQGQAPDTAGAVEPTDVLGATCSDDILDDLGVDSLTSGNVAWAVSTLIHGIASEAGRTEISSLTDERVHYFCEDTGLFDGGPDNVTQHGVIDDVSNNNSCSTSDNGVCEDGGPNADTYVDGCEDGDEGACLFVYSSCALGTDFDDCGTRYDDDADVRVRCPAGSRVQFFTVEGYTQQQIANLPCQDDGTCIDTLNAWLASPAPIVQASALYECENGGGYCDVNRYDLRDGKNFFAVGEADAVFPSFRSEMESAFRYRTRFRGRDGDSVGFTPEVCIPDSDAVPYCYDPDQIDGLRERADCLISIWSSELYFDLSDAAAVDDDAEDALDDLRDFLAYNFSSEDICPDGTTSCSCVSSRCTTYDGFERMYTELLVMLGDEALTAAFSSRFDLAATTTRAFEGDLFEEDGIVVSSIAGNEMHQLHVATQYYQSALNRFYSLTPTIWLAVTEAEAAESDPTGDYRDSFIEPELVTTYMDRLLRAASQKTRAWNAISERYMALGRSDLAELVVERAYAGAYMENVIVGRLAQDIRDTFSAAERPSVEQAIEQATIRFGQGMVDMRSVYSAISDDTGTFGFASEYIPLPVHPSDGRDVVRSILDVAWRRADTALAREETALATERSFDTDESEFQSELVRIRNTYSSQLGEICGTFEGDDGRIYPAITRYASESTETAAVGNPCGAVLNGSAYEALLTAQQALFAIEDVDIRYSNLFERIEIEQDRVLNQCGRIEGLAAFVMCAEIGEECENVPEDAPDTDTVLTLENSIRNARQIQETTQLVTQGVESAAETAASSTPAALIAAGVVVDATAINIYMYTLTQNAINTQEENVAKARAYIGHYQTQQECTQLQIDSEATIREYMLELNQLDLEARRAALEFQSAAAAFARWKNEARRLELEWAEVESMRVDVEASRNDPNVRIYRNDAILNADFTFEDALSWAYRATLVFEYYTSTTYANRGQLYLIRMVNAGDYNLQNYLIELENALFDFEDEYGSPDSRVLRLSLMNDVLKIPYVDEYGIAYSTSERAALLREALSDPAYLDENGYLTLPFSTSIGALSPLTRNHKIDYIQVDYVGSGYGDEVARFYLRALGTTTLDGVDGETRFFRLPERTAVIDTTFGGTPYFDASVYPSDRLRDYGVANTLWEFVINQRDETANQDIDLGGIDDIRIDIYYNDFTIF